MDELFCRYYSELKYNGTKRFWCFIDRYISCSCDILEIGAGPGNPTSEYLSQKGKVTGLDIDSAVEGNKYCQQTCVYDGVNIPFADCSFDLAVSSYVFEHVEKPAELLAEVRRVLRPGGVLVFRTPNLWHYVSIGAKILPDSLHHKYVSVLQGGRRCQEDIYKTYHRMNTPRMCRKRLIEANFCQPEIEMVESEPSYGYASRLLFYPMLFWERTLNSSEIMAGLRANIMVAARVDGGKRE
ncbi:MAG: class I SAM-dependent methyltransferase [Sedimentisphaerales bacterium]|nr:class I SAM-dependent methyltransferase [Sedimentisphaerales bacterium]